MDSELLDGARAALAGWQRGDLTALEPLLDPCVELLWWQPGDWDCHGREAVLALLRDRTRRGGPMGGPMTQQSSGTATAKGGNVSLLLRNIVFTLVVPGLGGVYVPWLILTRNGDSPTPVAWYAAAVIAAGVLLYLSCLWVFGAVGRGTPGVWDSPRRVVSVGPYRFVRNPIYIGALLIVSGEAWLFLSLGLLLYAIALAVAFHVLVVAYEEPRLRARFGEAYESYRRTVPRWIPRPPRSS
jgi:protein-S-isoprenylcysteine O-methyltransferase Ste14